MAVIYQPQVYSPYAYNPNVFQAGSLGVQPTSNSSSSPLSPTSLSSFIKPPGVSGAINSFGANLGFGQAVPSGFVGPMAPGALGSTTTLGSTLGAAGIGALGGYGIAKVTGGNTTGGSIGGALGGAAGSFAAGAGIGAGMLSAQALNFVLPGLGIVVGGLAGSLFGKKKPANDVSEFTSHIGPDGKLVNLSVGVNKKSSPDAANSIADTSSNYFNALQQATGVSFNGNRLRAGVFNGQGSVNVTKSGVGEVDPYAASTDDIQTFNFDPNDPKQLSKALSDSASYLAQAKGLTPEEIAKVNTFNQQWLQKQSVVNQPGGRAIFSDLSPRDAAGNLLVTARKT